MRVRTFYDDDAAAEGELVDVKGNGLCVVKLDRYDNVKVVRHVARVTPLDDEACSALKGQAVTS